MGGWQDFLWIQRIKNSISRRRNNGGMSDSGQVTRIVVVMLIKSGHWQVSGQYHRKRLWMYCAKNLTNGLNSLLKKKNMQSENTHTIQVIKSQIAFLSVLMLCFGEISVSYTHLDVYKRQVLLYWENVMKLW